MTEKYGKTEPVFLGILPTVFTLTYFTYTLDVYILHFHHHIRTQLLGSALFDFDLYKSCK
jgi:hypothetical protein